MSSLPTREESPSGIWPETLPDPPEKFGIDKQKTEFYNMLCKGAPARGLRGGASPST